MDSWFLVAISPTESKSKLDCWLRPTPTELMKRGGGCGFAATVGSLRRCFAGDRWVLDDGELLVATRGFEEEILSEVRVGDPAPPLAGKTLDGRPIRLEDYRGKYVLLDFWATWCGPCVAEIPRLQDLQDRVGRDERFVIVSLSLDTDVETPRRFVEDRKLPWAQGFVGDPEGARVLKDYGVAEIPATFLIGSDGKVLGKGMRGESIMEAVIEALGEP